MWSAVQSQHLLRSRVVGAIQGQGESVFSVLCGTRRTLFSRIQSSVSDPFSGRAYLSSPQATPVWSDGSMWSERAKLGATTPAVSRAVIVTSSVERVFRRGVLCNTRLTAGAVPLSSYLPQLRCFAVRTRRHREEQEQKRQQQQPYAPRLYEGVPSDLKPPENQQYSNQFPPSGNAGLSLGWQLFIAFMSSIGFYFGFVLLMRFFGGQRVAVVHVDQQGRPVDPNTGRPYSV